VESLELFLFFPVLAAAAVVEEDSFEVELSAWVNCVSCSRLTPVPTPETPCPASEGSPLRCFTPIQRPQKEEQQQQEQQGKMEGEIESRY